MHISALRKNSAPLLPEGTVKCTHLAPYQIHRGHQLKESKVVQMPKEER